MAGVGVCACRSVPCVVRSERVKKIGGLGVELLLEDYALSRQAIAK